MASPLDTLIERELGARVRPNADPVTTSIGTTAELLLRNNSNRIAFVFTNLSANAIYIGWFPDVSTSKSIRVAPNGGTVAVDWKDDYHRVGYDWYALAGGAGSACHTTEELVEQGIVL